MVFPQYIHNISELTSFFYINYMNDYFAQKSNTSLAVTQQSITSHWSRQPIFAHYTSIAFEGNVEIGC